MQINIIENRELPKIAPIKEKMDIIVPNIPYGIPQYNGGVWVVCGSGGSGKSSMLLGLFKTSKALRRKFDNIWYMCPMSSYLSVQKHPFEKHDKVFHELSGSALGEIYSTLTDMKKEDDEEGQQRYNLLFIDDFANQLKDTDVEYSLDRLLIKARHLKCMIIICVQAWKYFPLQLRRQVTNVSMFKPKSKDEWEVFCKEILMIQKKYWEDFHDMIFDEPYVHLDVDTKTGKFYKNFRELQITLPK